MSSTSSAPTKTVPSRSTETKRESLRPSRRDESDADLRSRIKGFGSDPDYRAGRQDGDDNVGMFSCIPANLCMGAAAAFTSFFSYPRDLIAQFYYGDTDTSSPRTSSTSALAHSSRLSTRSGDVHDTSGRRTPPGGLAFTGYDNEEDSEGVPPTVSSRTAPATTAGSRAAVMSGDHKTSTTITSTRTKTSVVTTTTSSSSTRSSERTVASLEDAAWNELNASDDATTTTVSTLSTSGGRMSSSRSRDDDIAIVKDVFGKGA